MWRKLTRATLVVFLVGAATATVAFAGSSTQARSAGTSLSLVAYSTPARGVREADPDVPEDARRGRRLLHAVVRRLGRPGAGGEGRSEGGHRRPLARSGRGRARQRGPRRLEVEEAVLQGHGHGLARRLRRPRRQPEEDQDLERPAAARRRGHHAEPVHVGRRPLERHGRVRSLEEGGQDRQAGAGQPAEAVQERRRAGHERAERAEHVPERQG